MTIISLFSVKQRAFEDAQKHTTLVACPYPAETDARDIYKKYFEIERANIERTAHLKAQEAEYDRQSAIAAGIKADLHNHQTVAHT